MNHPNRPSPCPPAPRPPRAPVVMLLAAAVLLSVSACKKAPAAPAAPKVRAPANEDAAPSPAAAPAGPRVPVWLSADNTTRPVSTTMKVEPKRIVSLAPTLTEMLFALDVGEHVVGVTRFCDRPAAAKTRPKVGGYVDVQVERILAQKPDLIVALPSLGQRAALLPLAEAGIPVLVGFADTLDELDALIKTLGRALGNDDGALDLVAGLHNEIIPCALPPGVRLLALVGTNPLVGAAPETFVGEIIGRQGIASVLKKGGPLWPRLSAESLRTLAPTHILITGGHQGGSALPGAADAVILAPDEALFARPSVQLGADATRFCQMLQRAAEAKAK